MTTPADVNTEATGIATTITLQNPIASDIFAITFIHDASATFPVGTTVVTWTATDVNGNASTATQNIVVSDTTAPIITILGNAPHTLLDGETYVDVGASVSDLVSTSAEITVTQTHNVPSPATEGVYQVVYTAIDAVGNTSEVTRVVRVAANIASNNGTTVSLTLVGKDNEVEITSDGEVVFGVSSSPTSDNKPNGVVFPYGVIDYYTSVEVGQSKTVLLTFNKALPDNLVLYKVDADDNYILLPSSVWEKVDNFTVAITLTDGDPRTDLDGIANGVIHDPLAVGGELKGSGCLSSPVQGGYSMFPFLILGLLVMTSIFRKKLT